MSCLCGRCVLYDCTNLGVFRWPKWLACYLQNMWNSSFLKSKRKWKYKLPLNVHILSGFFSMCAHTKVHIWTIRGQPARVSSLILYVGSKNWTQVTWSQAHLPTEQSHWGWRVGNASGFVLHNCVALIGILFLCWCSYVTFWNRKPPRKKVGRSLKLAMGIKSAEILTHLLCEGAAWLTGKVTSFLYDMPEAKGS